MNRDRQIVKDIKNKLAQAREEYAKNKSLLGEYKVQEKATEYTPPKDTDPKDELKKED